MSEQPVRPFLIELNLPIRTYDIDFAGVISNIVYIRWLEDLRLAMLEEYYPLERLLSEGLAPTLLETHIHYLWPVTLTDRLVGEMWIDRMTPVRFRLQAEFYLVDRETKSRKAAEAQQIGCLIETTSRRPARLPQALYQKFQEYS